MTCGAFSKRLSASEVKDFSTLNSAKQLTEIMHIHYKFGNLVSREIPIFPRRGKPQGKLADIVREYPSGTFFSDLALKTEAGRSARYHISNTLMYTTVLYRNGNQLKGRKGQLDESVKTNQLGLMLSSHAAYAKTLPQRHENYWSPDCRAQQPDYDSPYVLELIEYDTPYVSGPSGMASILLAQMEYMVNFPHEVQKQHYLSAAAAYIVAGGFHSLHEVLAPIQYALDLIPGYPVFVPGREKTVAELALPQAPQYHVFFTQQSRIDPEFALRREEAWTRYLDFFENIYMTQTDHLKTVHIKGKCDFDIIARPKIRFWSLAEDDENPDLKKRCAPVEEKNAEAGLDSTP